jgi:hypothetical protein
MRKSRSGTESERKVRLEVRVSGEFLLDYNHEKRSRFKVLASGCPPQPDIICKDVETGEEIGIEVTIVYYDEQHAKSVWRAARGEAASGYPLSRPDSVENLRVLHRANLAIKRKSKKSYGFVGRILLLVATYPRRLYLTRMKEHLNALQVPATHPFHEIYIYSTRSEPYQLFPERKWIGTYKAHNL